MCGGLARPRGRLSPAEVPLRKATVACGGSRPASNSTVEARRGGGGGVIEGGMGGGGGLWPRGRRHCARTSNPQPPHPRPPGRAEVAGARARTRTLTPGVGGLSSPGCGGVDTALWLDCPPPPPKGSHGAPKIRDWPPGPGGDPVPEFGKKQKRDFWTQRVEGVQRIHHLQWRKKN